MIIHHKSATLETTNSIVTIHGYGHYKTAILHLELKKEPKTISIWMSQDELAELSSLLNTFYAR